MTSISPKTLDQGGFTLLELIIVLFLITLLVGLSSVFLSSGLSAGKLHATVREMSASLRYARTMAHIKGETMIFSIDMDNRRYGVTGSPVRTIPPEIQVRVIDPFSGEVVHGEYGIGFHAFGGAQEGIIILSDNTGRKISLRVDPVIGSLVVK